MVALTLFWILQVYMLVLLVRVLLSWVPLLNQGWTPRGVVLVVVESVYFVTDPPPEAASFVHQTGADGGDFTGSGGAGAVPCDLPAQEFRAPDPVLTGRVVLVQLVGSGELLE